MEPEEAAAIREMVDGPGGAGPGLEVELRNFAQPRRLSAGRLEELARSVRSCLHHIAENLAAPLRGPVGCSLVSVREVNARGAIDELDTPFLVWCLSAGGEPGWITWDAEAGLRATEQALCGVFEEGAAARRFSPSERQVLEGVLALVVGPIVEALGVSVDAVGLAQQPDEVTRLGGTVPAEAAERLRIDLALDGPGGTSELSLFLPGSFRRPDEPDRSASDVLPEHLHAIPVELRAVLGSIDVPLADLLELEVGDVIPLSTLADSPVTLMVHERACGRARWGRHRGNLALGILELDPGAPA